MHNAQLDAESGIKKKVFVLFEVVHEPIFGSSIAIVDVRFAQI